MLNTHKISLECLIIQSPGNIVSDMDGEKVMMSIYNGKYYNLGEIGGVIWDLIEKPALGNQLIAKLITEYNIEKADCEEQVSNFLESLYKEGLIQIVEDSNS
ncbi:lasso peptide biosynthesis PqqD family chaperone [Bacillus sp. EB600]|uniref:lasso peptide biosynthesis PqqD family chaperone n=1 Tax=Bacillus sp. EB600 TaxID=2806345 RepID=UPI00210E0913|nr:lasso peptide biosynthesis PqqD family chaperone [Bacillus sp. EB600]MCQ6278910.1 lasso peptide biosynthesis PqqD family chaperone [Bacillus sp. EB600]